MSSIIFSFFFFFFK